MVSVNFDEFSKIRVLDTKNFEASEVLKDDCHLFTEKIGEFSEIVSQFTDILTQKSNQIEKEKLATIGKRIKVETEVESRKSKKLQLKNLLKEAQNELDRLVAQNESLLKVHQEQQLLLESLGMK
ncbi:Intraflagellar transport protein 20 [Clydaea vesicula]|uniref:Intraflagellar transport protein 20 n=1 Tax=Clydaea vesicula TaxID=447962 RepID=A0AAD5TW46_9FUNG|nr:Intraflagellar transport protein 20 [Clydaea vesicula]KAJ3387952.1 Intraflagellar transport protein 20 [Lobulomyces angularis]